MGFGGYSGISWTIGPMQTICTLLQTNNHTNTSSLDFYRPDALPDAQLTVTDYLPSIVSETKWQIHQERINRDGYTSSLLLPFTYGITLIFSPRGGAAIFGLGPQNIRRIFTMHKTTGSGTHCLQTFSQDFVTISQVTLVAAERVSPDVHDFPRSISYYICVKFYWGSLPQLVFPLSAISCL